MGARRSMRSIHALPFVIATLAICASALPSDPSTSDVVPETEETQYPRLPANFLNHLAAYKNNVYYKTPEQIAEEKTALAKETGECVTKFPCYYRSKVTWEGGFLKDYMLGGPIKNAITAIEGLTAYVCRVHDHSHMVGKWLKFDNEDALKEFTDLQKSAFDPETRLGPNGPLSKCTPGSDAWSTEECWMSAWVIGDAKFIVTDNPHVADVQTSKHSFDLHKNDDACIHCHKDRDCYESSWNLHRL